MENAHKYILEEVFRRAGNKNQLAKALGVSRQYVQAWTKVPLVHLTKISRMIKIPKKILRPDLYEN